MQRTIKLTEKQLNTIIKALSCLEKHYETQAKHIKEFEISCRFNPAEEGQTPFKMANDLLILSVEAGQLNIDINNGKLDV